MNTIDTPEAVSVVNDTETPALTRRIGNKTFEVFVHFSETSTETLTDKIMRLVHNDIQSANMT